MLVVGAGQNQYAVNNSLRFRSSATAYLSRTPAASGNLRKWTYSAWIKRGLISNASQNPTLISCTLNSSFNDSVYFVQSTDTLVWNVSNTLVALTTTQVFRDPSAWYHIVLVWDTNNATAANRARIYVNGSEITSFSTDNRASISARDSTFNQGSIINYVGGSSNAVLDYDGYLTEVNFIDGQALTPSSFGANAGPGNTWQPIRYAGTYGTNGFYLPFSDTSALTTTTNVGLGKDFSGNGNYWTTNNISITAGTTYDAMKDVPTLTSATVANYCVLNPIQKGSNVTISEANSRFSCGTTTFGAVMGSVAISSGKWYWETIINVITDAPIFGIADPTSLPPNYPGGTAQEYSYYPFSAIKMNNNVQTSYGVTCTTGDIVGCALDLDNGKIWWSKNGTWMASGDPVAGTNAAFTGISGTKAPCIGDGSSGSASDISYNFGQRPFSYTPPSGYVALNTYNLPTPSLPQGNKYMDATLYTGNGGTNAITNTAGFKPDLVWMKCRSATGNNALYNDVSNGFLYSNLTNAEDSAVGSISVTSNGFTLTTSSATINGNTSTYVGWQWQAGQGTTSTNTSGTIPSTVSVNPSAGFSIVTYVGSGINDTVGHGLGVAPKFVIVKSRNPSAAYSWFIYHTSLTSAAYTLSFDTAAQVSTPTVWNSTAPTSTVFSIGTAPAVNESGKNLVAYCWAAIPGFSAFGSYTGNGSADGPFVYLGFRPKYLLVKITDTAGYSWNVVDTSRSTYNVANLRLMPNSSAAEDTGSINFDLLSNGFKVRDAGIGINQSGSNYIYAAFAENPFKYSSAR